MECYGVQSFEQTQRCLLEHSRQELERSKENLQYWQQQKEQLVKEKAEAMRRGNEEIKRKEAELQETIELRDSKTNQANCMKAFVAGMKRAVQSGDDGERQRLEELGKRYMQQREQNPNCPIPLGYNQNMGFTDSPASQIKELGKEMVAMLVITDTAAPIPPRAKGASEGRSAA